jgi:hypothetical protein
MAEDQSKKRRTLPIYAVMQVMGDNGEPMAISKDQVKIIGGYKSAENVLDIMESGQHKNAIYKKISLD